MGCQGCDLTSSVQSKGPPRCTAVLVQDLAFKNLESLAQQGELATLSSLICSPPSVPFRETPSYAKRRRLAGPSGLASPRPLQRSASDINLKGEVQPAASPGPTLRSLPHQLLLQRLQEEKDRDRDSDHNEVGSPTPLWGSQSKIR